MGLKRDLCCLFCFRKPSYNKLVVEDPNGVQEKAPTIPSALLKLVQKRVTPTFEHGLKIVASNPKPQGLLAGLPVEMLITILSNLQFVELRVIPVVCKWFYVLYNSGTR
jgi:hypothetical protein